MAKDLFNKLITMNKNIIVACDVSNHDEIIKLLSIIQKKFQELRLVYNILPNDHLMTLENLQNSINLYFMMVNFIKNN